MGTILAIQYQMYDPAGVLQTFFKITGTVVVSLYPA